MINLLFINYLNSLFLLFNYAISLIFLYYHSNSLFFLFRYMINQIFVIVPFILLFYLFILCYFYVNLNVLFTQYLLYSKMYMLLLIYIHSHIKMCFIFILFYAFLICHFFIAFAIKILIVIINILSIFYIIHLQSNFHNIRLIN